MNISDIDSGTLTDRIKNIDAQTKGSNIVLSPEYAALRAENDKLRAELSVLLYERDELALVICKNIEAAYMLELGSLECEVFEMQCDVLYLKRKIELIQAKINRQEKIDLAEIEAILEEEFSVFKSEVEAQLKKMSIAINFVNGSILTVEEAKELKRLYRSIVKALHPDLHPEATPAQKRLFENAMQAYENGDLDGLRIIYEAVADPSPAEEGESGLDALIKERERLTNVLELVCEQIEEIKSEYPYTMKEFLDNPDKMAERKVELEVMLKALKTLHIEYEKHLEKMLR